MSAVGGFETTIARLTGDPDFIAYAAFDAGLVDLNLAADGSIEPAWRDGTPTTVAEIEARHGATLREQLGIRVIPELHHAGIPTDIAAPLPHDLAVGGLRRQAGLTFREIRGSALRDMHALFDDDPRLGPSVQSQLFAYGGIGALAALPKPLAELVPAPADFRVASACAFPALDALSHMPNPLREHDADDARDKFAARLASSLASHGPALISAMLSPSYPLSRAKKNPGLLDTLPGPDHWMRVPQTPSTAVGACASSLIAFSDLAAQLTFEYPGYRRPHLVVWTAADAATLDWKILEGFGPTAMMTSAKLAELNADRSPADQRPAGESLAPFDIDAAGTVVGDAGSGVVVTTLDFALRNHLDITSIVVGWGQSGETGGKAHFAGVGFGGENAIIQAYDIAREAHGYGVGDFEYLVAHATGTRTNSKTDLTAAANGRAAAAARAGVDADRLAPQKVGTPKALGDGHTMGETGLKAVAHALRYVLGEPSVGLPALRHLDPDLGEVAERFSLDHGPLDGDADGGAICPTQGFGGYNGAVALRAANPDSLARYGADESVLREYLERWPESRRERVRRERESRLTRGSTLALTEYHRW